MKLACQNPELIEITVIDIVDLVARNHSISDKANRNVPSSTRGHGRQSNIAIALRRPHLVEEPSGCGLLLGRSFLRRETELANALHAFAQQRQLGENRRIGTVHPNAIPRHSVYELRSHGEGPYVRFGPGLAAQQVVAFLSSKEKVAVIGRLTPTDHGRHVAQRLRPSRHERIGRRRKVSVNVFGLAHVVVAVEQQTRASDLAREPDDYDVHMSLVGGL